VPVLSIISGTEANVAIIIETELQSDLEVLYKIAGDLLNEIERKEYENNPWAGRAHELLKNKRWA